MGKGLYTEPVIRRPAAFLIIVALALAACKRAPEQAGPAGEPINFGAYQDSDGNFRFEAPMGWQPMPGPQSDKTAPSVYFRGFENVGGQRTPVDVAVLVSKLPRNPQAFASPEAFERYRRSTLLQVDALFGPASPDLQEPLRSLIAKNVQDISVAGIAGKTYRRDYDYIDPHGPPGAKPLPVSLEEIVLRTPEAYYVLEYRARRDLFDRYHFAADRLKASFKPGQ